MQLTELLTRRLVLEKGDKVGKVLVTNSINDVVSSMDNVTMSCTELAMYDGAIVDTLVLCKGLNLTAKIGYHCVANTIHIGALASVYIAGTPEIHSIHIQENGRLHVGLAFLSKTKDIVLNFEENAILYVDDKYYEYRGYKNPHEFIDNIIHPKLSVIKDSVISIFLPKEKKDAD